jgi:transglutaminase-like putative cysteine protease
MGSHRQTIAAGVATMLAATSLYPLFIGTAWWFGGLGATVTVALVGTLTRLRRLPVLVCLLAGAAGLLLYLNLVFAYGLSFGHVLPTLASLHRLTTLTSQGTSLSAKYAPPVPELTGMLFLAVSGIGIVAVLTDLIAVRLRSAALAGIPLLLLVTEPFTVSASRGWLGIALAFCLGVAGYLGLLATEGRERIREWEQPQPGSAGGGPDTSALSSAGRRVGIASIAIALCLPLFIPGLHTTRLFGGQPGIGGHPGSDGSGGGLVGLPSPVTAMTSELQSKKAQPVLQYTESGPSAATGEYLQLYVLDQLTAADWHLVDSPGVPVSGDTPLPPPPGLANAFAGTFALTTVHVSSGVSAAAQLNGRTTTVLPVPYPALNVSVQGSWQVNKSGLMVYSTDTSLAGLTYQVRSLDLKPATQDVAAAGPAPASIVSSDGGVPASFESLRKLAQQLTKGKASGFDKALALQAWLSSGGGFTYTLQASPVLTPQQLVNFLTYTKHGYCQQFAVAMAVLGRLLGIPSRVVIGYTSGTRQHDGSWLVTTHDAHEWPEMYFSGFGWLRFEPTPSGADGQGTAVTPGYAKSSVSLPTGTGGATGGTAPSAAPGTVNGKQLPPDFFPPVGAAGDLTRLNRHPGLTPWEIFGIVVGALALLALIVPPVARLAIRRRRWRRGASGGDAGLAHVAWQELRDDLIDYRAGYSLSETPRALRARVAALVTGTGTGDDGAGNGPRDLLDGGALDGAATNGPATNGAATNGSATNGAATNGPATNGSAPDGSAPDVVQVGAPDQAPRGEIARASVSQAGIAALKRITIAEERARYSARPVSGSGLRRDSAAIRRAIAVTTTRRDRWRARLLPSSVLTPTVSGVSQAADVFGRLSLRRGKGDPANGLTPDGLTGDEHESRTLERVSQ